MREISEATRPSENILRKRTADLRVFSRIKPKTMGFLEKVFNPTSQTQLPDKQNRFNAILQRMMATRWYITALTLFTFVIIAGGILVSIASGTEVNQEWKEILLLMLGAFIGSYNRVIDYWFNNDQRDQVLIQKVDEEDDEPGTEKKTFAFQEEIKNNDPLGVSNKKETDEESI